MGIPIRQYTPLGKRVAEMCGNQEEIAVAIGRDRSQLSRRLRGLTSFTIDELISIARHFNIDVALFFKEPDMDSEVLRDCYRMFLYDPIALDHVVEAFRKSHKNLKSLGEIAEQLSKESDDAVSGG